MVQVCRGDIIGFKVGGQWRFDEKDINNYIDLKRRSFIHKTMAAQQQKKKTQKKYEPDITPVWLPGMSIKDITN
jgi:hypothetical protein